MGNETVVIIPRLSIDETPTLPPFPLVKVSEFVDSSLGFALSRATLGVGALFFGSVFVACSLPDVALPPPSDGPLWRLGPGFTGPSLWVSLLPATAWLPCLCAWSVCCALSPLFIVSHGNKGLWPCVGIFPSTPCFLCIWGAVCSLTEVFIIV